jgi:hypothetical protein
MLFVLFQEVHNVDERIGFESFRDSGQKRRIEPANGSVILERELISVTRRIRFWLG